MSLLDDLLESAAEAPTPSKELDVEIGGQILSLKFYQIDGRRWAEITAMCPTRLGSVIDRSYGYNFQAASQMAAPLSGRVVVGDEELQLDNTKWDQLFTKLAGTHVRGIHSLIWELNEYDPQQAVAKAKKALMSDSEPKPA
jgi:hypothetical protein